MRTAIDFLGRTIYPSGLSITTNKVDALQNWPAPRNLHELRSLLGTFGFWRTYIHHYAHITHPLTLLTRKGVAWRWGEEEANSLVALKQAVRSAPVLMSADCEQPFFLVTDASDYAIGCSLEQLDEKGNRRPVTYISHQLSQAEQKYPVQERELLAKILALRTWRHLLLGSEFSVECQTDHRPLQSFLAQTTLSPRQVRWQPFLSEYNLTICYIPGKVNEFAHGLSRVELMIVRAPAPYDSWLSRIQDAIAADPQAESIRKKALNVEGCTKRDRNRDTYIVLHGVLYYRSSGLHRVYVPEALRRSYCMSTMISKLLAILDGARPCMPCLSINSGLE